MHGCPHYGPAIYNADGYNQEGYHRDTGLNRQGLTFVQEMRLLGGGHPGAEGEEVDNDGDADDDWNVLQHLDPAQRAVINELPDDERDEALNRIMIALFETQGILFGRDDNDAPPPLLQENADDEEREQQLQGRAEQNDENRPTRVPFIHGPPIAFDSDFDFDIDLDADEDYDDDDYDDYSYGDSYYDDDNEASGTDEVPSVPVDPALDDPEISQRHHRISLGPSRDIMSSLAAATTDNDNTETPSPAIEPSSNTPTTSEALQETHGDQAGAVAKEEEKPPLWAPRNGWPANDDDEEL